MLAGDALGSFFTICLNITSDIMGELNNDINSDIDE
jgi:hypothetical protein